MGEGASEGRETISWRASVSEDAHFGSSKDAGRGDAEAKREGLMLENGNA